MPRFKLLIEYDGRPFSGWQRQNNAPSVMGLIEKSLLKFTGEAVTVFGAGRTDTGVHAIGQVAHFALARDWHSQKVHEALNHFLKETGVAILDCWKVTEAFDARFLATKRYYRYRICNRRAPLTFEMGRAWQYSYPIDIGLMQQGADQLVGHFDFTTFRATACQAKSPWRTMERLEVSREGEWVYLDAMSRSFLHNQIRSFVGSLVEVGAGRKPVGWITEILEARDRTACGPVAPPDGLYLTQVDYPPDVDYVIDEEPWELFKARQGDNPPKAKKREASDGMDEAPKEEPNAQPTDKS